MENNALAEQGGGKKERWGQARRLEFIDSRLCWEGRLNRSALTDFFKISVPQASLDLAEYLRRAPDNAVYDLKQKAYLATEGFRPLLTDLTSARYLAELYALTTELLSPDLSFLGSRPAADVVRFPTRLVPPAVLRQTLAAIRDGATLSILYQPMTRPEPSERVISPHALGYDGFRWHVRAYCHLRGGYRDFVFARILQMHAGEPSNIAPADDLEWHRQIRVVIAPNPALSAGRRAAIELDYGMQDGQLAMYSRHALAFYLLKRLGLTTPPPPDQAHVQQIVLVNRDELVPLLPQLAGAKVE